MNLNFWKYSGSGNIIVVQESLIGPSLTLVPNNSLQAAPISEFVAALATVLYVNTEEEPTSDQRMVAVIANDRLEPLQSMPNAAYTSPWLKAKMAVLHGPPFGGAA